MTETAQKVPTQSLQLVHSVNTDDETIRSNVKSALARSKPYQDFMSKGRRIAIVGGGPSLSDILADFEDIAEDEDQVWALNNAWRALKQAGVLPNAIVMMDARPENAEFVDVCHEAEWLIASQCHPAVFNQLELKGQAVTLWHCAGSEVHKELGLRGIGGGGTVLSRAINLAYERGFRHFKLFGVDSSHRGDDHHAYPQPLNDGAQTVEVWTEAKTGPFITTGAMAGQAKLVFQQMASLERQAFCTFELVGDGLLPTMWRERKAAIADADKWEPAKYRRMWKLPQYRVNSPAEQKAEQIAAILSRHEAKTVVDFGTGTGRGAARLQDKGFAVTAIDFAANCLDDDVDIPLIISNLWKLPAGIKGDAGTCIDVMEHIPMEKVDAVLSNISKAVGVCVFNISFRPDQLGALIGEKLHMTVRPPQWWLEKLQQHFQDVTFDEATGLFEARNSGE